MEPFCLGICVCEFSNFFLYVKCKNMSNPENLELERVKCGCLFHSFKSKDSKETLKKFKNRFDYSEMDQTHYLYSLFVRKLFSKFHEETLKSITNNKLRFLGPKSCSIVC